MTVGRRYPSAPIDASAITPPLPQMAYEGAKLVLSLWAHPECRCDEIFSRKRVPGQSEITTINAATTLPVTSDIPVERLEQS